jgi:hypothetical protein
MHLDKFRFSSKHLAIDKANTQMVAIVAVAAFITVFCLVAAKTVFSQYLYQSKVMSTENAALSQLKTNVSNYQTLVNAYNKFETGRPIKLANTVAGSSNDNSQIVLDALPAAYDFPGLTSTIENILDQTGMQVTGITGTDEGTGQSSSANPSPQPMPFGFSVSNASYASTQQLIQVLQQSIRPISIDTINITASNGSLTVTVAAHSYYKPAKTVNISTETVN